MPPATTRKGDHEVPDTLNAPDVSGGRHGNLTCVHTPKGRHLGWRFWHEGQPALADGALTFTPERGTTTIAGSSLLAEAAELAYYDDPKCSRRVTVVADGASSRRPRAVFGRRDDDFTHIANFVSR